MTKSIGFWDTLFGKRVTLETTTPNGGIKKVVVTKKWLEKMERNKKIQEIKFPKVIVNILDPLGSVLQNNSNYPADPTEIFSKFEEIHRVECWTIGDQISQEQYETFLDLKTKELYAVIKYENGKPISSLAQKSLWERLYNSMKGV